MNARASRVRFVCAGVSLLVGVAAASAQVGYGVNANGMLFRFDLTNPNGAVVNIGNVGFVPEGIDFRPGTSTLYAIDIGPNTTQLYTIDITTGAAAAVGTGFSSSGGGTAGPAYNLGGEQTYGFDFNPTTLQGDGGMRIRLVSSGGSNLRLNSLTGGVAAIDSPLNGGANGAEAAAYTNSAAATAGGATTLYVMNAATNALYTQIPPNAGTLNLVGQFGVTINNSIANINFDILTDPGSGQNTAYAVLRRPDAPSNGPLGAWMLYQVNLATGQILQGALVGIDGGDAPADFTGGLAVIIPAPGVLALAPIGLLATLRRRR